MPIVLANILAKWNTLRCANLREVVDGEFFLEVLVDVVQDASHSRVIERTRGTRDAIDQVSIDVILDEACREHQ